MAGADAIHIPRSSEYSAQLAKEFQQLWKDGEFTDFTIHCGTQSYPCHKSILAGNSPFLKAMIKSDMAEGNAQEVKLEDIWQDVMEIVLEYMYTGEVSILPEKCQLVIKASDFFQIPELKKLCVQKAPSVVQPANVVSWYKLANLLDLKKLKSKCEGFIYSSLAEIAKYSEFLELSVTEMNGFISVVKEVDANSDDMLEATLGWVDHKVDERVDCIEDLMQQINLSECSKQCLQQELIDHDALLAGCSKVRLALANELSEIEKQGGVREKTKRHRIVKVKVVLVEGHNNDEDRLPRKCWELGPDNEFVELCEMPDHDIMFGVCMVPNGFVLTGGQGCTLCSMFVMATKSWQDLEPFIIPRDGHGSVFANEKIYVFGGDTPDQYTNNHVMSLMLTGGVWTDEPAMPIGVRFPEVVTEGNSIYLLDIEGYELLHFDIVAGVWSKKAVPPEAEYFGASMVMVQDQLMVAGAGQVFAQYNTKTDSWRTGTVPLLEHHFGTMVGFNRKLYLMGGQREERVEEYDLDTECWSVCDFKVPDKWGSLHALALDDE